MAGLTAVRNAAAQDPVVDRLDSINLHPGQTASVVVNGKQLAGAMSLWTPVGVLRPKDGQDLTKDQPVTMVGVIGPDSVPGIYPARLVTNHGCSEAAFVVIDDLLSLPLPPRAMIATRASWLHCPAALTVSSIRCFQNTSELQCLQVNP